MLNYALLLQTNDVFTGIIFLCLCFPFFVLLPVTIYFPISFPILWLYCNCFIVFLWTSLQVIHILILPETYSLVLQYRSNSINHLLLFYCLFLKNSSSYTYISFTTDLCLWSYKQVKCTMCFSTIKTIMIHTSKC